MTSRFNLADARGLIFDCDGTLLDTMPVWNRLEADFARMAGVVFSDEQLEELRAVPTEECAAIYHDRYGLGESQQDVLRMMDEALLGYYRDEVSALPGVARLLRRAQELGIPCTVVTSSPRRYVDAGLRHAGIDGFFKRVITTDEVGLSKQGDRIWLLAVEEMGSTPDTTWGFDDAAYAVRAMRHAGIHAVGAYDCDETGTYEQLAEAGEFAVHSLEELLEA
jgi:HAD superfamily hydrolase (TIGR01509 family)